MILQREPALISGLVAAVIALVTAFGFEMTGEQVGSIMAATYAVLSVIVRSKVTPVP